MKRKLISRNKDRITSIYKKSAESDMGLGFYVKLLRSSLEIKSYSRVKNKVIVGNYITSGGLTFKELVNPRSGKVHMYVLVDD